MKKTTGTVGVVGNEPFTHLVLTPAGTQRQILVLGPLEKTLRESYQGKTVTLEGSECTPDRPGFSECITPTQINP